MKTIILVATSLDGFIAEKADQTSTDWTSKTDKDFFKQKTIEAGVIIFGRGTFETINRPLKDRRLIIMSRSESPVDMPGIEWTKERPVEIISRLKKEDVEQVVIGGGSQIYSLFLQESLVDEIWVSVHPVLFGAGVSFAKTIKDRIDLIHFSTETWENGTVLLEYRVK